MFKQAALQSGYSPEDVESFLATVKTPSPAGDSQPYDPTGKPFATVMAETGQQSTLDEMGKKGFDPSKPMSFTSALQPAAPSQPVQAQPRSVSQPAPVRSTQQDIVPLQADPSKVPAGLPQVTQPYGARNSVEKFSGGVNLGTDFRTPVGTPLAAPQGSWVADKVVAGGREGDRTFNSGSGNMVVLKNKDTGETIGFEHLGQVGVQPGQPVEPGTVIGTVGLTGNTTGPHASIPYRDASGQYKDVLSTPYVKELFTPQPSAPAESTPPPVPEAVSSSTPVLPSPPVDPASKQAQFIQTMTPYAEDVEKKYGIPKAVTLAQAGLESGFNPEASTLFGIKGSGNAGSFNTATKEDYGSGLVSTRDNFAKYNSTGDAFDAYGQLLTQNPRYASVVEAAKTGDKQKVVEAIKNSGYATDPEYVSKVMGIINKYGL